MINLFKWHINFTEKKELHMVYLIIKDIGSHGIKLLFLECL